MSLVKQVSAKVAFWREALTALVLSITGAVLFSVTTPLMGSPHGARLVLVLLSLIYLLWVLKMPRITLAKTGRQSVTQIKGGLISLAGWLSLILLLGGFNPAIWIWLISLTAFVWLVRCYRNYRSLWLAGGDALLNGLALVTALATAMHTQSVFLSLWSFFLVQAAWVLLPELITKHRRFVEQRSGHAFDDCYRAAEAALDQLSVQKPGRGGY